MLIGISQSMRLSGGCFITKYSCVNFEWYSLISHTNEISLVYYQSLTYGINVPTVKASNSLPFPLNYQQSSTVIKHSCEKHRRTSASAFIQTKALQVEKLRFKKTSAAVTNKNLRRRCQLTDSVGDGPLGPRALDPESFSNKAFRFTAAALIIREKFRTVIWKQVVGRKYSGSSV